MATSSSSREPTTAETSPLDCTHSLAAILEIPIFILMLFCASYLIISMLSYIFLLLCLILPPFSTISSYTSYHLISMSQSPVSRFVLVVVSFVTFAVSFEICYGHKSRRCGKEGCLGLKQAMETVLQLQGQELLRTGNKVVRDVNELPWKGGSEDNPEYEYLREDLRKMAPPNGRAVLLYRDKCGCPVSKLEGWGPKRGWHNGKSLALTGEGDNR